MARKWEKAYGEGRLILRDHLAYHRTVLANQRTLMAYIRTSLAFIIAGLSFMEFFESGHTQVVAWIFIPMGVITGIVGLAVYAITRHRTLRAMDHYAKTPPVGGNQLP